MTLIIGTPQYEEWQRWLDVVKALRARDIEINDDDDLNDALVAWGNAQRQVGEANFVKKHPNIHTSAIVDFIK